MVRNAKKAHCHGGIKKTNVALNHRAFAIFSSPPLAAMGLTFKGSVMDKGVKLLVCPSPGLLSPYQLITAVVLKGDIIWQHVYYKRSGKRPSRHLTNKRGIKMHETKPITVRCYRFT